MKVDLARCAIDVASTCSDASLVVPEHCDSLAEQVVGKHDKHLVTGDILVTRLGSEGRDEERRGEWALAIRHAEGCCKLYPCAFIGKYVPATIRSLAFFNSLVLRMPDLARGEGRGGARRYDKRAKKRHSGTAVRHDLALAGRDSLQMWPAASIVGQNRISPLLLLISRKRTLPGMGLSSVTRRLRRRNQLSS
jgi:hypothetical protein